MTVEPLKREFYFGSIRLPDISPKLTVEDVQAAYSTQYPDIATASISGPEVINGKMRYTFERAIGSKG
jgi:PRTRC genetic system protein C